MCRLALALHVALTLLPSLSIEPNPDAIKDFIEEWDMWLANGSAPGAVGGFFCHHNRAIFMDSDWSNLWSNVSDGVPQDGSGNVNPRPRIAIVTDFSNSYTSQHRLEHMQKFWSTVCIA